MKKIAIIGAGMAGLTLATRLQDYAEITIFEKSRGCGGRMSTRRAGKFQFDHGAQYFTARSTEFRQFLQDHFGSKAIQDWQPRVVTLGAGDKTYTRPWFEPHWVGIPGMNSIGKALAGNQAIQLSAEVKQIRPATSGWHVDLQTGEQHGPFDWIVSTAPAPQSSALFADEFLHHEALSEARLAGCFSLMLGFKDHLALPFGAAVIRNSPLGWLAIDSVKPGRVSMSSLLVQSTNQWAEDHLLDPLDQVQETLLTELEKFLPQLPEPEHAATHRWRHAATVKALGQDYLLDEEHGLACCGDWCLGGRVEAAFTSADRLAAALTSKLLLHRSS